MASIGLGKSGQLFNFIQKITKVVSMESAESGCNKGWCRLSSLLSHMLSCLTPFFVRKLLNNSMLRHFVKPKKLIFLKFSLRLLRLFAANQ